MKKLIPVLCLLTLLILGINACDKIEGCTDITAENYYDGAQKDDNSCTYVSDEFVGTYSAIDTMYYINNAQVFTDTIYYEFTIDRIDKEKITISNFSLCNQEMTSIPSNIREFIIEEQGVCLELRGGFKLEGKTLSYGYFKYPGDGEQIWSGAAELQ